MPVIVWDRSERADEEFVSGVSKLPRAPRPHSASSLTKLTTDALVFSFGDKYPETIDEDPFGSVSEVSLHGHGPQVLRFVFRQSIIMEGRGRVELLTTWKQTDREERARARHTLQKYVPPDRIFLTEFHCLMSR